MTWWLLFRVSQRSFEFPDLMTRVMSHPLLRLNNSAVDVGCDNESESVTLECGCMCLSDGTDDMIQQTQRGWYNIQMRNHMPPKVTEFDNKQIQSIQQDTMPNREATDFKQAKKEQKRMTKERINICNSPVHGDRPIGKSDELPHAPGIESLGCTYGRELTNAIWCATGQETDCMVSSVYSYTARRQIHEYQM